MGQRLPGILGYDCNGPEAALTCTLLTALHGACDYSAECATGLYCTGAGGTCETLHGAGEPCTATFTSCFPDGQCMDFSEVCGTGLTCARGAGWRGCFSDHECAGDGGALR